MSSKFLAPYIIAYENAMAKIGVKSAWQVGLLAATLTGLVLWTWKPESCFDDATGRPRPWSLLVENSNEGEPVPTIFPWYARAATVGYCVNLIA